MPLNSKFKQDLKAKAHKLKPIVLIGNHGLTANVIAEIDRALTDHELIKIRINALDKEEKKATLAAICEATQAEAVQLIGKIGILYRKTEKQ